MTDLTKIPGIGKNMAQHLIAAGYPNIDSSKGKNPEDVYAKDCFAQGVQIGSCACTAIGWRCITPTTTGSTARQAKLVGLEG